MKLPSAMLAGHTVCPSTGLTAMDSVDFGLTKARVKLNLSSSCVFLRSVTVTKVNTTCNLFLKKITSAINYPSGFIWHFFCKTLKNS